jgi:hypothetical protein
MRKKKKASYNSKNLSFPLLQKTSQSLENKILALLFEQSRLTAYDIKKGLETPKKKIAYSTLHGITKTLLKSNFLKIAETMPYKNTVEKKLLEITPLGIRELLPIVYQDVFIECALRRKDRYPLISKIEEWKLIETPLLAGVTILRNSQVFFGSETDSSAEQEIIDDMALLLEGLVFWDDFKKGQEDFQKELEEGQEADLPYIQTMINITPNNIQLRKEAHTFLKNNPWIKPRILEKLRETVSILEKELDLMRRIYEKSKRLLS